MADAVHCLSGKLQATALLPHILTDIAAQQFDKHIKGPAASSQATLL